MPPVSRTFHSVRCTYFADGVPTKGYLPGIRPSSALRPFGHQPPHSIPRAKAQSSAARSAPVCPPETILGVRPLIIYSRSSSLIRARPSSVSRSAKKEARFPSQCIPSQIPSESQYKFRTCCNLIQRPWRWREIRVELLTNLIDFSPRERGNSNKLAMCSSSKDRAVLLHTQNAVLFSSA